jgi:type I restriction enzyme S subunit
MKKEWSEVALGEVLEEANRYVEPQPGIQYRQMGVRLWGQGAYERESIDGGDTQYAHFNCCETGDLVLNKIWARNGSVSVVQPALDGCFVSTEFPLYKPEAEVLSEWLRLITKTSWFWKACDEKAQGTSGKNRIKPSAFLEIVVPLPPMTEQQRIVAHLDAIESRLTRAQKLRNEEQKEKQALIASLAHRWDLPSEEKIRKSWTESCLGGGVRP